MSAPEDRSEGLAEQSVNTSTRPPAQSGRDHAEDGDGLQSGRSLTGNDQRRGLEQAEGRPRRPADPAKR